MLYEVITHMAKGITLQELDTTATSRLVIKDSAGRAKVTAPSAADEIALKSTVDNTVGDLSTLKTTDKSNVVKAINELFTNVNKGKNEIAAALIDMGQPSTGIVYLRIMYAIRSYYGQKMR